MIIKVDQDNCIGCGLCANTCPEVFKVPMESDRCEVVLEKPYRVPKNLEEDVARAIDECPVTALSKE